VTGAELLATYRREMHDTARPYLWDDEDVLGYLDDAQRRFCQKTLGIRDAVSAACEVVLTAGEAFSPTHPSIRQIRSVHLSDGSPVETVDWVVGERLVTELGRVRRAALGVSDDTIRWEYVPEADDTASLVIFRGPLGTVSEATADAPLEVPNDYTDALLMWARHRGYAKDDADTYDARRAAEFEEKFERRCAEIRRDQERRTHTQRTVAYGGY
jgi:hypothetical protein